MKQLVRKSQSRGLRNDLNLKWRRKPSQIPKHKNNRPSCSFSLLTQEHDTYHTNSFINPDYGWDTLSITSSSMQNLLHHLGVFPQFFKYLCAFGMKSFALDEGFGGFDCRMEEGKEGGLKRIGESSSHCRIANKKWWF